MHGRARLIALVALMLTLVAVGVQSAQARGRGGALPYMGRQPSPSIFGIDTGSFDSVRSHYARDFRAARGLGSRWDRFGLSAATASGNFSGVDDEVTRARKLHMGVVLSFQGIPQACSVQAERGNVGRCPPTTSGALRQYQAYVRRVLVHYRHVVTYYESWIEINHDTSVLNAAQYAALLKAQYAVFRTVNRLYHTHLKLLWGSEVDFQVGPGSHWMAVLPFTQQVLGALQGAKPFDGVALHGYRFPPASETPSTPVCDYVGAVTVTVGTTTSSCTAPDHRLMTWPEELTAYEQEFQNQGYGTVPLWLTEFGWPGAASASDSFHPSFAAQAADVAGAYHDLLQLSFVRGALWFNLRDYQPGYKSPDPEFFYHYGLLNYNYAAKSAAAEFQALAAANPHR